MHMSSARARGYRCSLVCLIMFLNSIRPVLAIRLIPTAAYPCSSSHVRTYCYMLREKHLRLAHPLLTLLRHACVRECLVYSQLQGIEFMVIPFVTSCQFITHTTFYNALGGSISVQGLGR